MTGAILERELLVPVRRLRTFVIRGSYGLALAATFGIILLAHAVTVGASGPLGNSTSQMVQLAERFAAALVNVTIATCLVFTPAYIAGAIAAEKDRRTIAELLLTTMSSLEIVLSKLFGRLAHVAAVLIAGLPLFAIAQLLGGVSSLMLVAVAAMTLLWLVTVGSFSLLISVVVRRTRDAVLASYTLGVLLLGGINTVNFFLPTWLSWAGDVLDAFNPFFVLLPAWVSDNPWELGRQIGVAAAVLGTFSAAMIGLTVCLLRRFSIGQLEVSVSRRRRRATGAPEPSDQPMLWKEKHFPPAGRITALLRRTGLVAVVATVALIGWQSYRVSTSGANFMDYELWNALPALLAWPLYLSVMLTASSAFSGERERTTWDAVLASPLEANEIVLGKCWGSIWEVRWWLLAIALASINSLVVSLVSDIASLVGGATTRAGQPTVSVQVSGSGQAGTVTTVQPGAASVASSPASLVPGPAAKYAFVVLDAFSRIVHVAAGVLFALGVGLRVSLQCRTSGKALGITLAIWVLKSVVASTVLGIAMAVFFLFMMGDSLSGGPVGLSAWFVPLIGTVINGLVWGFIGAWLVRQAATSFDQFASRIPAASSVTMLNPTS